MLYALTQFDQQTHVWDYNSCIDMVFAQKLSQHIVFYIYKKNCETFCHTATLLIHTLKYLASISLCFTKEKKEGRV